MIKCPECQKDISDIAKKCPNCGFVLNSQPEKQKKGYVWKILGCILALVIIGSIFGNKDSTPGTSSSSTTEISSPSVAQPDYLVSPQQIVAEYDANEIAADNKYKGKIVRITARVEDIGKDIMDSPYITFSDNQQFSTRGVQCYFKKSEAAKLADVRKGQQVTIQGKVDGLLMNVFVKDSIFVNW